MQRGMRNPAAAIVVRLILQPTLPPALEGTFWVAGGLAGPSGGVCWRIGGPQIGQSATFQSEAT